MDSIEEHPWFGTGLGTTAEGADTEQQQGRFASVSTVTSEHGSSYLAIIAGVGILGSIPCFLLLFMLTVKVFRTVGLMRRATSAAHPAIPLAMVMVAGIVHAAFEDWMFAPGNYLCVFFWSVAFILVDVTRSSPSPAFAMNWPVRAMTQPINGAASTR
jgi:O-antigen ligase